VLEFARTAQAIGATPSTLEKSRLLADYLRALPPDDLRLAVVYMTGLPLGRADRRTLKAGWATLARVVEHVSGLDGARLATVYRKHADPGDWAEEVLQGRTDPKAAALADVAAAIDEIEAAATAEAKGVVLEALLRQLTPLEAKYVVKVLTGDLRIGLREGLVEAAIARAFDVELDQVKRIHMLTGDIGETALRIKRGELATTEVRLFQPIRYMLASPVETAVEAMERVGGEAWTEEKYDGVRCQLHTSNGRAMLFSRDLKETTAAFPELAEAVAGLGHEVLLDGEVLAHRDGRVLRFFELQRRLGRKDVSAQMRREVPVVLVVFDLLLLDGRSLLELPLAERRRRLEELKLAHPFLLARREFANSADDLERIFAETRERGNEGLMVKDPGSPYTPGRRGLAWLKLKRPLATLDVVVTAVEWGHGKRRGVLSDYTFGVLDEETGRPVNVGKAYTGLTDAEIAQMTQHFLAHTVEDRGWVRSVELDTVIEVAFDSIQRSSRHRSGYALRFPRIVRLRPDKPVSEIDTLKHVEELYERYFGERSESALSEVEEVASSPLGEEDREGSRT
jgi:DNA ligase-1